MLLMVMEQRGEFSAVSRAKLGASTVEVVFDSADRYHQPLGNLTVGQPPCGQSDNLALTQSKRQRSSDGDQRGRAGAFAGLRQSVGVSGCGVRRAASTLATVRGSGLGSGVSGQQQSPHLFELDGRRVQGGAVVGGQRGGMRGGSGGAESIDLGGQFSEPVGQRAVPETDRGVQRDYLHGRLILRRGQLSRLAG